MMRFITPSFRIMQCPDGDEVLAFLEEAARTCYKSEDKIDDGFGSCPTCKGTSWVEEDLHRNQRCPTCRGTGKSSSRVREPSSHRLIRKILKTDYREQLLKQLVTAIDSTASPYLEEVLLDLVMGAIHQSVVGRHESVIEHAVVSVRLICNRGVSHELVRHRLASYSMESTRYCNYSRGKFGGLNIIEPSHRPSPGDGDGPEVAQRRALWVGALTTIEETYLHLLELGEKPQEARDILPIGLKTEVVSTFNLRQWRYVFIMRGLNERAHPQIRELMLPLLHALSQRVPVVFDDLVDQSRRLRDTSDEPQLWDRVKESA